MLPILSVNQNSDNLDENRVFPKIRPFTIENEWGNLSELLSSFLSKLRTSAHDTIWDIVIRIIYHPNPKSTYISYNISENNGYPNTVEPANNGHPGLIKMAVITGDRYRQVGYNMGSL